MTTETFDGLTLPNGRYVEVNNIPATITQAELQDILIKNDLATPDEFKTPEPQKELFGASAGRFIKDNPDITLGTGFSLAGGAVGAFGGPVGIAVGSTGGGFVGDFIGTLAKQGYQGEDLDFMEAFYSAFTGLGIDIATLGLERKFGQFLDPLIPLAKKKLGFSPEEAAQQVAQAGSVQSLRNTQKILQEGGATLTPSQLDGRASGGAIMMEKLGEVGILSSNILEDNAQKVNRVAQETIQQLIGDINFDVDPRSMGEVMYEVLQTGKQAGQELYQKDLKENVTDVLSNKMANTTFVQNQIRLFLAKNQREGAKTFSVLDDDTVKFINNSLLDTYFSATNPKIRASSLLDIDKKISQQINKLNDPNSGVYNTAAGRELAELSDLVRKGIQDSLQQIDPKAAASYAKVKQDYSNLLSGLLPDINKTFVSKATKGDYNALGKFLTEVSTDNTSQLQAFYKSLDTAFDTIAKRDAITVISEQGGRQLTSAAEAKQLISQGYLKNLINDFSNEAFDIQKYGKLAEKFNSDKKDVTLKLIMGDNYKATKQLFNLMAEAARSPEGNVGTLLLRSKEYAVPSTVGRGLLNVGQAGLPFVDMATGGAVLLTPIVFAKMSTNPKAINKLLAWDKTNFKDSAKRNTALTVIIGDVIDGMTQEEQAELRNFVRGSDEPVQ